MMVAIANTMLTDQTIRSTLKPRVENRIENESGWKPRLEYPAQIQSGGGEIMLDAQAQHQSQGQANSSERQRLADDHYRKLPRHKAKSLTDAKFIPAFEYSHKNCVKYSQPYHREDYPVHDVVEGVVKAENLSKHRQRFPPRQNLNRRSRQLLS